MGLLIVTDIFQKLMSALMNDLYFVIVYLDNFLVITSGLFEENLAKVEEFMNQLQSAGIKCKIDKCKFSAPKVEYLGYIINREGIKPYPKTRINYQSWTP